MIALSTFCLTFWGGATAAPQLGPARASTAIVSTGDYLSARFAGEHHDLPKAADLFAKCLDRDRDNPQLLASAFFYAVAAGRIDDGAGAYMTLAAAAMKHHDYKQARAYIAKSHQDGLVTYTVSLFDAWAAAGLGDKAAVQGMLNGLHQQSGIEAVVMFNEALLAEYFGQTDQAETAYRKLMQRAGPSPRLVEAYGRFLERRGQGQEARDLYDRVQTDPAMRPLAVAGKARIAQGRKPSALISSPEDGAAEALLGVATSIADENGADVSIVFLQLTRYLRPNFELADLMMADRLELVGNYEAAIAIYDAVPPSSSYYRVAVLQSATDKLLDKKPDAALADLQTLSKRFPDDLNVWMTYGDVLRQLKKYDEAVKAYTAAVAMVGTPEKKNWSLFFARANAAQSAGDWKAAESDLKLALKLNPQEPQILNFLGYTWVDQQQNLTQAVSMLEKANKLAPNDGYITDSVGWAYYRLGRYRDAAEKLENAVLLVPQDPTINDHLGDVYWKMGRKLEAEFQWNHALASNPADEDKAKIVKKLQNLPAGE